MNNLRSLLGSLCVFLCGASFAQSIDLKGVYELAVKNDPQISAAQAAFNAQSEVVPQARAGLLPGISISANYQEVTSPSLREFNRRDPF